MAMKTIVASVRKQPFEKHIDTGVTMVTPDNLDSPETQAIVNPPIAKYLGGA